MAILATQRVLTLDYWKLADSLQAGDIIFDRLGNPVTIKIIQKFQAQRCYEVEFSDGTTIAGDEKLKLPIETRKYRNRVYEYKNVLAFKRPLGVKSAQDLAEESLVDHRNRKKYSVPTTGAIQFPTQPLPVPPFLFGFWFFNKRADHSMKPPKNLFSAIEQKFKDNGYQLTYWRDSTKRIRVYGTKPSIFSHLAPNVPTGIPDNYLFGSIEQRTELLSGILHSKSRAFDQNKKAFYFTEKNYNLIRQVQNLAESLGCKTSLVQHDLHKHYTLTIRTSLKLLETQEPKPSKVRQNWRYITKVNEIKPQGCVYIETNSPDKSFLVEEGYITCF